MNKKNIIEILKSSNHYSVFYADIEKEVNGEFVKNLRYKLNMTQNVFASVLGVTKKTIEKWEQGANPVKGCSARLLYLISKDVKLIKEIYNFEFVPGNLKEYKVPSVKNTSVTFSNNNLAYFNVKTVDIVEDESLSSVKDKTLNVGLCC